MVKKTIEAREHKLSPKTRPTMPWACVTVPCALMNYNRGRCSYSTQNYQANGCFTSDLQLPREIDRMRIAMIGTGYVGLVSGACFSEFGASVTCVDQDAAKIAGLQRGEMPIYEPGLAALVAANAGAGRLSFTTDLEAAVAGVDAVFIAVGTPSRRGDGHADLSYVFAAAEAIGRALSGPAVVVTKSTVPVGTGYRVAEILRGIRPEGGIEVAANPEFLREGSAIADFMRPDRVVIGAETDRAREVMRTLYRPLYLIETPIVFTDIATAELIKYAANAFLATKITFINEIADLC